MPMYYVILFGLTHAERAVIQMYWDLFLCLLVSFCAIGLYSAKQLSSNIVTGVTDEKYVLTAKAIGLTLLSHQFSLWES